jgi:signal transduction histidine kinase/PAS domain-containing protein
LVKQLRNITYVAHLVISFKLLEKIRQVIKTNYRTSIAVTLLIVIFNVSIGYNYLLFHTLVELFSIIVAFSVFTITWNSRKMLDNNYLYLQGITYLFIGALDLLHTITFKGMHIIIDPIYYSNQFWVATRFLEAAAIIAGFLFFQTKKRLNADLIFAIYTIITLLIILSILKWEIFPICYVDAIGQTTFKIYSEYSIIALLLIGIALLFNNRKHFETSVFKSIFLSMCFAILSEFCFTLYVSNYSASNAVGHYAKLIAFFFTYKAVVEKGFIQPTKIIFKNLSDSERKYRTLSENLPELILRFDKHSTCLYANNAVKTLLSAEKLFYVNKNQYELGFPLAFADCIGNLLEESVVTKKELEVDFSFSANKHHSVKIIPEYSTELDDFTYLIISYDISNHKENEKNLQELNATKDRFFSIIAHDLKTPFTSILAFSELIQKNTAKFNAARIEQMAFSIKKSAQNAYALLENLLSWSRLQTGALQSKPELMDAVNILRDNVDLFSAISALKGVSIHTEATSEGTVYSDKQMLNTVLRNLITNAIKFSHPNSSIILGSRTKENMVQFKVQDFGTGIEPRFIDRLFDIESSFSTTGTNNEKGSGLGLILCKEFVEKSGGTMWLETIVGKGTCFYFTVPAGDLQIAAY